MRLGRGWPPPEGQHLSAGAVRAFLRSRRTLASGDRPLCGRRGDRFDHIYHLLVFVKRYFRGWVLGVTRGSKRARVEREQEL